MRPKMMVSYAQEGCVMLEWVYRIADRVDAMAKADPEYRELFLEYMNLAVDMQYRKSQLAWYYGKQHSHD